MKITYLDVDTQEVIDVIDDPSLKIYEVHAEEYAVNLNATVARMIPGEDDIEWTIELIIHSERR